MPLQFDEHPSHREQLLAVAGRFGTPTYAYFESTIRRQCAKLRQLFQGLNVRLLYAMKANSSPSILRIVEDESLGLEIVSPGELVLALKLGFPAERVLFSANNMTDEEMTAAHEAGALLNVGELSRLDRYGRAFPGSRVSVRLNPQVGAGHHEHVITAGAKSKFGIPVEEAPEVGRIVRRHGLELVGLHQHIGSGILEVNDFARAISVLIDAAPSFPDIRFLNFGGGLGVPYRPGESDLDFQTFRQTVLPMLHEFRSGRFEAVEYWFEPGRFIVAESGTLLVEANTIKRANGRTFAGTNSGMGHLARPTIYNAYHGIVNLSNAEGDWQTYDVAGNICESGDVFARSREIREIREGDMLAVMDAGAYGMSMASTYNLRPLPAEVMIRADGSLELVRPRLSPGELADQLIMASSISGRPV